MSDFSKGVGVVFMFVAMLVLIAVLTALPVMMLWNALMPDIFGLTTIGFWQALGLTILSSLLFKSSSTSSSSK